MESPTKILSVVTLLSIIMMKIGMVILDNYMNVDMEQVLQMFILIVGCVFAIGLLANIFVNHHDKNDLEFKKSYLKLIASKYNLSVKELKNKYKADRKRNTISKSALLKNYSSKYDAIQEQYLNERKSYLRSWRKLHRRQAFMRTFWGWMLTISMCGAVIGCSYSMNSDEAEDEKTDSIVTWNADNIPIPHLEDYRRYVSNPDNVLTESTVSRLDGIIKHMEDSLGIESVVIVVNYIENDDPFRMAQDVGNRYGVGREDLGLVIVVGYEDHSINISPGRALETFLTDAECYRLEQRYVVPAMKAAEPDSALIYLTEALSSLLEGKELPTMSDISSTSEQSEGGTILGGYLLFFLFWSILTAFLDYRYEWTGIHAAMVFPSNPFIQQQTTFVGSNGGISRGRYGGGGGFSGGSFGGGSFGGGGATSRW